MVKEVKEQGSAVDPFLLFLGSGADIGSS